MKRRILSVMLFAVISFSCLLLSACNKSVSLVDFEDQTVQVEYASVYQLELDDVKDKKGNSFKVEATVTDSNDKKVAVFEGKFDVVDLGGYTVLYQAYDGTEVVGDRTVTITVNTDVEPTLSFSGFSSLNDFELNKKFILPTVVAHSPLTEDLSITQTLVKIVGQTESEITIENGEFIPDEACEYEYRVTVNDGLGNEKSIEYGFTIRQAVGERELESFNHPAARNNVSTKDGSLAFDLMEVGDKTVGGVENSLKLNVSQNWPIFLLKPRQEIDTAEYPWISFKVYVDGSSMENSHKKTISTYYPNDYFRNTLATPDAWTTVYVDSISFVESMDENGFGQLFSINNDGWETGGVFRQNDNFICYVSSVTLEKGHAAASSEQIIDVSNPNVLQNVHCNYTAEWDFGFDIQVSNDQIGENTAAKLKLVNDNVVANYPGLKLKPVNDLSFYSNLGYTHVKVPMYIDGSSLTQSTTKTVIFFLNTENQVYKNIAKDTWTNVVLPLESLYASLDEEGYSNLFTIDNEVSRDVGIMVYLGDIVAFTPAPTQNNLVMDTENVDTYTQGITYQTAAIGGVTDALKLTVGAGGQAELQFLFKPSLSKKDCQDSGYTHAKLRVYIDSQTLGEESKTKGSKFCIFVADYNLDVEFDKWVEIELTIDRLYAAFNSATGFLNLFSTYNFDWNEAPYYYQDLNFNIYFDDITAYSKDTVFSAASSNVYYNLGITYERVDFAGVEDALKLTVGAGNQQQLQFCVNTDLTLSQCKAAGYTHVKFRVYLDSSTLGQGSKDKGSKFCIFAGSNNVDLEFDKWVEIELTVDQFYANYIEDGNFVYLFSTYNFDWNEEPYYYEDVGFNLYFDDITAITK